MAVSDSTMAPASGASEGTTPPPIFPIEHLTGPSQLGPQGESDGASTAMATGGGNGAEAHTGLDTPHRHASPCRIPPRLGPSRTHFNALVKWEGHVVSIGDDSFLARLTPLLGPGRVHQAEILLEEIAPEDRFLVQPGAVFYWSIGYLEQPSGRTRQSVIRFRRLPAWTPTELQAARARSSELRWLLEGE